MITEPALAAARLSSRSSHDTARDRLVVGRRGPTGAKAETGSTRGGDFDGKLTTIGNVGACRKMGNLKAYLFDFFASFYLVVAAWFSVGPVMELARWLGMGALDWVVGLVVFLGLLQLAVEVTSSLRRN